MNLHAKIHVIYAGHKKSIRDAHMKILQLERIHANRTAKENEQVFKKIINIIEEAADDNK